MTVILRTLHILFGIFWAGTTFFTTLILEPRLRRLGSGIQNPVMNALMPIITPLMMLSSLIVLGTGVVLTFSLWSSMESLFTTTPGIILTAGFVLTVAAMTVGFGFLAPTGMRMGKLAKTLEGRAPSQEETAQLSMLSHRIEFFSRINFVLILLSVLAMALLRNV
jgi:uncharacterized membrane protein